MQEIWKDIPGYEGLYQISNLGNIKSFNQSKLFHGQESHLLKLTTNNNGYIQVTLYNSERKRQKFSVHRLVASAFVDNPNNYSYVNHKDENKINNAADNLEWCTMAYNNAYGTARTRARITKARPICQYTLEGNWIATYLSASYAAELLNIDRHRITDCCAGKTQSACGYIWEWTSFAQK